MPQHAGRQQLRQLRHEIPLQELACLLRQDAGRFSFEPLKVVLQASKASRMPVTSTPRTSSGCVDRLQVHQQLAAVASFRCELKKGWGINRALQQALTAASPTPGDRRVHATFDETPFPHIVQADAVLNGSDFHPCCLPVFTSRHPRAVVLAHRSSRQRLDSRQVQHWHWPRRPVRSRGRQHAAVAYAWTLLLMLRQRLVPCPVCVATRLWPA
eukprot:360465-Chlamydomonas_euryale.AAC.15